MGRHSSEMKKLKNKMEYYTKYRKGVEVSTPDFTKEDALVIAKALKIDFDNERFDLEEFLIGINVELEHGSKYPQTNITNNDPILSGKIAYAHLKEFPDYYERLKKLEAEAEEYWSKKF